MITAKEALALPSAQISPSDQEAANKLVEEIDVFIRANMTRKGCVMPLKPDRLNDVIAPEVIRILRRYGWATELRVLSEVSPVTNKPRVTAYQFSIAPFDKIYDEYDAENV